MGMPALPIPVMSWPGLELGRQVGERRGPGSRRRLDAEWNRQRAQRAGPLAGTNPRQPDGGTWKTWTLSSNSQFDPVPPPCRWLRPLDAPTSTEVKTYRGPNATNLPRPLLEFYGGAEPSSSGTIRPVRAIVDNHLNATPRARGSMLTTNRRAARFDGRVLGRKYSMGAPPAW